MRIPYGTLKKLSEATGLPVNYLSDIANTRKRPGRIMALKLQDGAKDIGLDVRASVWLYGHTDQIKTALSMAAEL